MGVKDVSTYQKESLYTYLVYFFFFFLITISFFFNIFSFVFG